MDRWIDRETQGLNRLSVHQWLLSAIHASARQISPIGFLSLKLPRLVQSWYLIHIVPGVPLFHFWGGAMTHGPSYLTPQSDIPISPPPSRKHAKFSSPSSAFSELCKPCAAWKPPKTPRKAKLRSLGREALEAMRFK